VSQESATDTSQRIERLLADVRAASGPIAWQRVEELMSALMELYAHALSTLLEAVEAPRREQLATDELLGSLLLLHGLHPLPVDERVRRALDAMAAQLGRVELVEIIGERVRLRAVDAPPFQGAAQLIERVVQETAPELERVEIEGLREGGASPLVQIDLARSRGG
jgi:hypothetical protein